VTFRGGSGAGPLNKGQAYDLRFLGDRIVVCRPGSATAIVEMPYRDVETVEVNGSGPSKSAGELLAWIVTVGGVGAFLGLHILHLLGLLLGILVFGVIGALAGGGFSNTGTIIRLRARDAELFFSISLKPADAVRIELSEPLRVIENARAAQAGDPDQPAVLASGSIPDQLSKLASLQQQGMITRDEFEHLKGKLIAQS
jgi:hypothetical protein